MKKNIWRRLYEWDPTGPGKFTDTSTYLGCFRALGVMIVATYFMWYSYDFLAWCRWIFDIPYEIDGGKQSWSRVWTVIIGGMGIFGALLGMVNVTISRYRARKSAIGQWYDRPNLTCEMLYGEDAELSAEAGMGSASKKKEEGKGPGEAPPKESAPKESE